MGSYSTSWFVTCYSFQYILEIFPCQYIVNTSKSTYSLLCLHNIPWNVYTIIYLTIRY